jgi:hypothetical protein
MKMKTNQFFSFKRFSKYASCSFISNYRQTLLFWGAVWFAVLSFSLLNMRGHHSNWNNDGWVILFMLGFYIAGLLYSGFAFPSFRSKERTLTELMIPVSTFERLLYEFIEKIVAFMLLYPVIFYVASCMAVGIRNTFKFGTIHATINGVTTFPFETVSFQQLNSNLEPGLFGMLFMLSVLAFVLALAGSATFRKLPLIKMIVFVGLLLLTGIGYFYMLFEKWNMKKSWIVEFEHKVTAQQGFHIGVTVFAIICLIAMSYTYFKLKEKEAV